MELKDYIYLRRITFGEFAKEVGLDPSNFSKCLNGKIPFSERVTRLIELISDGKVTKEEIKKLYRVEKYDNTNNKL